MRFLANYLYRRAQAAMDRHTNDLIETGGPSIMRSVGRGAETRLAPDGLPQLYRYEYSPCEKCGVLHKGVHECAKKVEAKAGTQVIQMRRAR